MQKVDLTFLIRTNRPFLEPDTDALRMRPFVFTDKSFRQHFIEFQDMDANAMITKDPRPDYLGLTFHLSGLSEEALAAVQNLGRIQSIDQVPVFIEHEKTDLCLQEVVSCKGELAGIGEHKRSETDTVFCTLNVEPFGDGIYQYFEAKLALLADTCLSDTVECPRKYEFCEQTVKKDGHTLHRIRALRDFGDVRSGELGGYIESESNLSHTGDCWVDDIATVYGNAAVSENAQVNWEASVSGDATISGAARILGHSNVSGHAAIHGFVQVEEHACISGDAHIHGTTKISGSAHVMDEASVSGEAWIYGNAVLCENAIVEDGATVSGNAVVGDGGIISGFASVSGNVRVEDFTISGTTVLETQEQFGNLLFSEGLNGLDENNGLVIGA